MKNLPKEKRDRLLLISVGTVVAVVVLWYLVIQTQNKAIARLKTQSLDHKTKVENAQRLLSSTAELQKQLDGSAQELKTIEDAMASGDMYSWIILTPPGMSNVRDASSNMAILGIERGIEMIFCRP